MIAKREARRYAPSARVWAGKYLNSHNLPHWHYDCEFLYCEKGELRVFCEKRWHTLQTGESLFIDSGQVHYMHARDPETVLAVLFFDCDIIRPYLGGEMLACPKLSHRYPVAEHYARLRAALSCKPRYYGAEAACEVLSLMLAVFRGEEVIPRAETKTAHSFRSLLETLDEKFGEFTFSDAAAYMGMSEAYFSRYFRGATGTTFSQYLNFVRTDNAVRLLQEFPEMPVTEIAGACGFGTIRSFNRTFRELTGYSPRALPNGFALNGYMKSETAFAPTLRECVLLEAWE